MAESFIIAVFNEDMSETDLIIAFNNGDRAAFTTIYKLLYPDVYAFATRFVSDEDSADITAEVFIKLLQSQQTFQSMTNIKAWLLVVVRNSCLSIIKKEKNKLVAQQELAYRIKSESPDWREDQEHAQITSVQLSLIKDAIGTLPAQKQTIFQMAYMEGKKNMEIATILHLDQKKIENTKTRMLSFLREFFAEKAVIIILSLTVFIFA